MIHFDFYEDPENSLDLLIKFGHEQHHPESVTIEESNAPHTPKHLISVTSPTIPTLTPK